MRLLYFIMLFMFSIAGYSQVGQLRVDSQFPGGNILVEKIRNDTIWCKPDSENTRGDWFYWYFKVSGISGKTVTFQFTQDNVLAAYGPAYTINHPDRWKWLGAQSYHDNSFFYTFGEQDTCAWFAMAFPYTQADFNRFVGGLRSSSMLMIDTLCVTGEGREVEQVHLANATEPEHRVLITARHHACEMMANYVLEGIINSVINEKDLEYLRNNVEFRIIPFVDKDGVENGDQGKNRIPRDHNRDYDGASLFCSTKTLRDKIPGWSENKLKLAMDIHCPWIRGEYNEYIYMVGTMDSTNQVHQRALSQLIEQNSTDELPYFDVNFLPYGKAWNTDENYHQGRSFTRWAVDLEGISVATSVEFPYANVSGIMVSKDNARAFGKALAFAMQAYLKSYGKD